MKTSKGISIDRGYVKIRIWPWGKKAKPYERGFGPATPENVAIAEFELRNIRNKIALGKFSIEAPTVPMTFQEVAALYISIYGAKKPPTALRDLKYRIEGLSAHFGPFCLHEIKAKGTPNSVEVWRETRLKSVTFATVNREQAVLSSLFNWAQECNALETLEKKILLNPNCPNPCEYVSKPSERHRRRTRVMSPEEWDRLKLHLSERLLDHCYMALYSTLRLKDISMLAGAEIKGDILRKLQAKTGQEYQLPFTESLRTIAQRISARPYYGAWSVQKDFREACQAAHVKDLTFRDLRRTSVTYLDKLGVRDTVQRDRAGHSDSKTTELYRVADLSEQLDGIRKLEQTFK